MSVEAGDLSLIDGRWYVTHSGLLRLATRRHCCGIAVAAMPRLCDPSSSRWAFKATVYKSPTCKGFVGHGDADPSNVSPLVRGAEMRVAETRAVNRALRKAYGIGICSVEEIGSLPARSQPEPNVRKLPPQPVNGNGEPKLRDQLCLLIRQHRLDAALVKQYAADFCGTRDLRQASREQVATFITGQEPRMPAWFGSRLCNPIARFDALLVPTRYFRGTVEPDRRIHGTVRH